MSGASAVWFRRDLRIHDHGPLLAAAGQGPVFCVYCVDPRELGATRELGLPRLGALRYPDPVVDLESSVERNRQAWEAAVGR